MIIDMDLGDLEACSIKDPVAEQLAREREAKRAARKAEAKRKRLL